LFLSLLKDDDLIVEAGCGSFPVVDIPFVTKDRGK
jgi:hypothetical protein